MRRGSRSRYPGVDVERFRGAAGGRADEHLIVSPGRLVWEKGHYDVHPRARARRTARRGC